MEINFAVVAIVVLPALIVGLVCFFSIDTMLKKELMKQKYQLLKANQKEMLPLKLQAYERVTLLLERISLTKLLVRVSPISEDINDYKNLLMATIDQEFDHNLTQQIYISDDCWKAILAAKNTVITQLHALAADDSINNANEYRNLGLTKFSGETTTQVAQSFVRNEIQQLF